MSTNRRDIAPTWVIEDECALLEGILKKSVVKESDNGNNRKASQQQPASGELEKEFGIPCSPQLPSKPIHSHHHVFGGSTIVVDNKSSTGPVLWRSADPSSSQLQQVCQKLRCLCMYKSVISYRESMSLYRLIANQFLVS